MQLIYAYTRQQALADGVQVDVSTTAREAGITFPVFLTRAVWDKYVEVPEGVANGKCGSHQDEAGRLWDIVWMLRFAILRARPGTERVPVALYVRNEPDACPVGCRPGYPSGARLVKLVATCGPLDLDDPQPAITVMLPDED
jgi:hypothetical protein